MPYKHGRSTHNEGILWKLKRFRDGEARITAVEEGIVNNNAPVINNLGETIRSLRKENLAPSGMVGRLIGVDRITNDQIIMSPDRMTHDERRRALEDPRTVIGRTAKYKAFDYGKAEVPRFITFQGWRDELI